MATVIVSNGSKWAGQQPDGIDRLLFTLNTYALDPTFEEYGDFFYPISGEDFTEGKIPDEFAGCTHHFFGNFWDISHVFNIYTNDLFVIAALSTAIRDNQKTQAYAEAKEAIVELKRRRMEEEQKRIAAANQWRVF